jgi:hypothetical protein
MKCAVLLAMAATLTSAQTPKWNLALAANGTDHAVIAPGWPLLLRASIDWTAEGPGSDTFDPAIAVWKITSASGVKQNWQITQLSGPRQKTQIDGAHDSLTLEWGIAPQQTTAAASGEYVLQLSVSQAQATVKVKVNPATQGGGNAESESTRRFIFAQYELASGDAPGALALMQEELKANPDSVSAMSVGSRALENLNRKREAFAMLTKALSTVQKQQAAEADPEPATDLRRRYRKLRAELLATPKAPK